MQRATLHLRGWTILAVGSLIACSVHEHTITTEPNDAGTESGNGGTSANADGSSNIGGTGAKAGSSSTGGSTVAAGGTQSTGGASSAGGNKASGGTVSLGGATGTTGGTNPAGGASAIGGAGGTSGTLITGGTKSSGTVTSVGGINSTGGATSTGGISFTGGTTSTLATGGAVSTGGTTTGDAATGGAATGGSVATGGAAGAGCTGSFETIQSSTGLCVAKMVPITAPSASQNYSIDVTEVTKGQYDMWLATNPALPASTDVNCGYVTSYAEQSTAGTYTGTGADHHPVVYVDWCDAYAYCKGVGKRLCGAISGGTNPTGSDVDATASQWYRACSSGGVNAYPYGNTYEATYCDGYDYWNDNVSTAQTVSVGSLANCVTSTTGYAGVYDLSGNVWELEDSCDGTGESANCAVRSGAFYYSQSSVLNCSNSDIGPRNTVSLATGFRCCSL